MKDKDAKALELLMEEVYNTKLEQIFKRLNDIPETYKYDEENGEKPGVKRWISHYHMAGEDSFAIETIYNEHENVFYTGMQDQLEEEMIRFPVAQADKMINLIWATLGMNEEDDREVWIDHE